MAVETVDIGGAAASGRPQVPEPTTVAHDDSGFQVVDKPEQKVAEAIPERVQRAVEPGTQVAYPQDHPANNSDLNMDSKGRLLPEKGQILTKPPDVLGDVQNGFVTDQKSVMKRLAEMEADEDEEVEKISPKKLSERLSLMEQNIAKSSQGAPLIEVEFHLDQGAIVGYYNKVEQQGRWLIFIVDNTSEARQRFVPRPGKEPIEIVVTGVDKIPNRLSVVPLGMQFTLDNYDFMVMLVQEIEDGEA